MKSLAKTSVAYPRCRFLLAAATILFAAVIGCSGHWLPRVCADEPTAANDSASQTASIVSADPLLADSRIHGGLVVLVGCSDAELAISLAESPNVLVHGLVRDDNALEKIRQQIRNAGLYGRVSMMAWNDRHLPYADGMVNLLLVPDEATVLAPQEIDRVLAPLGEIAGTPGRQAGIASQRMAAGRRRMDPLARRCLGQCGQ